MMGTPRVLIPAAIERSTSPCPVCGSPPVSVGRVAANGSVLFRYYESGRPVCSPLCAVRDVESMLDPEPVESLLARFVVVVFMMVRAGVNLAEVRDSQSRAGDVIAHLDVQGFDVFGTSSFGGSVPRISAECIAIANAILHWGRSAIGGEFSAVPDGARVVDAISPAASRMLGVLFPSLFPEAGYDLDQS